ncbi:unnamed protein product [Candida verbasci]|uniref:Biogenesis of lysosome-related organelles complex 1 subunit KXD1 n=1 Tax=Candida verbasci TaxID=1227364 RepID=A0A9W4XAN3_9ASCO|nr:unnamed protein product [Candida verbasci]
MNDDNEQEDQIREYEGTTENQSQSEASSDDYILSDDEELHNILSHDINPHLNTTNLSDHASYFQDSLSNAMDSIEIDKSLALKAQISGNINNENQKLIEKNQQLKESISRLQELFKKNFAVSNDSKISKVDQMKNDIVNIEKRIKKLTNGYESKGIFKNKKVMGVAQKFPIEYNKARDKVLERQINIDS